ncbi:hypothetical protein Aperf_G00000096147 [Anoplocephala perfoliata]
MEDSRHNHSTYYSDEESQGSVEGAYNLSAVGSNAADESNEYRVDPLMSPNTPAYHPTKTAITHEDSESLSSVEENQHKADPAYPKTKRDLDEENESSAVEPAPKRKRTLSTAEEDGEYEEEKAESADKALDDKLDIFGEDPDEERDDKQGGDFEGFDGDGTGAKDMIADIFGESDAEGDGDFEGFAENEVEKEAEPSLIENMDGETAHHHHHHREHHSQIQDDDSEVEADNFMSDFDLVAQRMRNERRRRRRLGKDVDFLNDIDDTIRDIINQMREAAAKDRELLSNDRPATKKLSMLKTVNNLLIRTDILSPLIDNGILSVIAEWLSPVSGRILPSISIRECLLSRLKEFNIRDPDLLKESGLGKAVMFIYKHPKETSHNKKLASSLITSWSRPVFGLPIDYSSLTKEERKQMDCEHLTRRRGNGGEKKLKKDDSESKTPLRPGDPGFVPRARVPQPSNRDYVIRPKWNVPETSTAFVEGDEDAEGEPSTSRRRRVQQSSILSGASSTTRIERQIRALSRAALARKKKRFFRASNMSIEGRNLSFITPRVSSLFYGVDYLTIFRSQSLHEFSHEFDSTLFTTGGGSENVPECSELIVINAIIEKKAGNQILEYNDVHLHSMEPGGQKPCPVTSDTSHQPPAVAPDPGYHLVESGSDNFSGGAEP